MGCVAFLLGGALLAVTLPYHDWDSFAYGAWSRDIAEHGRLDPLSAGVLGSARPVFYVLQGGLWTLTGVNFTAGRLLSLAFALVLLGAMAMLARCGSGSQRARTEQAALAVLSTLAIAPLAQEALAGKSDVPVAALLALTAALALRQRRSPGQAALLALVSVATMLAKPTATVPLVALVVAVAVARRGDLRASLRWTIAPLSFGLLVGWIYQAVMAARFHSGLLGYLRSGTTDGLWGQRAAAERWNALLRLDAFGPALHLPLAFALIYGAARTLGLRHRPAWGIALPASLLWALLGPTFVAGAPGAFATPDTGFAFVGFACVLLAAGFVSDAQAPERSWVGILFVFGVTPFVVWIDSTAYFVRLAAAAWPGLGVLLALCLWCGVRGARRLGPSAALAPVVVVGFACWMALATFDGLHGAQWVEYRSLGIGGLRNQERTMNIVLPSVQEALALAEPRLGTGKLWTSDPRFAFFLPGRVQTGIPQGCADLRGFRVLVLDTSDESETLAKEQGALATPAQWAACRKPALEQLSDGSDGFAVFAVRS